LSKYLPNKTSIILEGGCGDGHLVDAMNHWGYRAIGVDFAAKTISEIKKVAPNLDVRCGDVRSLEFEDGYFDGYFSLGVIEHFWDGYAAILSEMKRVLKVGGYAFVAVPSITRLERIMMFSMYGKFKGPGIPDNFYQFALDANDLKEDFKRIGFECVRTWRRGDWAGFERFVPRLRSLIFGLQSLSEKSPIIKLLRFAVMVLMSPICGDNVLLVLRKK
jgi:SAM-dependent methyltransferase